MKSNRQGLRNASSCCAEFGPEDGIDARIWNRQFQSNRASPKDLQLRKRAERIIHLAFSGESPESLSEVVVRDVELSDDGRMLAVYLYLPGEPDAVELERISARLASFKGDVRNLIAQSLRRRRVPALRFRVSTVDRPYYFEKEV